MKQMISSNVSRNSQGEHLFVKVDLKNRSLKEIIVVLSHSVKVGL